MKFLQHALTAVVIILAIAVTDRLICLMTVTEVQSSILKPEDIDNSPFIVDYNKTCQGEFTMTDDYDSKLFSKVFTATRPIAEIRQDNYGTGTSRKVVIWTHEGGKALDRKDLEQTVRAVVQRMPNLKTTDELIALAMETMATETGMGAEKVSTGISKWNNYGICQFRIDTAEETLGWLQYVRKDVYTQVMSFYQTDKDMAWNLSYNVPFSIAMMLQYYWRRVPDLYSHIGTQAQRAEMWKAAYNTSKGLGTVQCYLDRCVALR